MIVFAIVQRQRDNFIDRNNFRVTQCRRKQITKFIKVVQQSFAGCTVFADKNRCVVADRFVAVGPCGLATGDTFATGRKSGNVVRALLSVPAIERFLPHLHQNPGFR